MKAGVGLVLVAAFTAVAAPARAEPPCTGETASGGRFATCFDLGNRLHLDAGVTGYGGGVELRHIIHFEDEPDLVWKLDHDVAVARAAWDSGRVEGTLYRGLYLRHARDGHLVLPFALPRKIFLPFDAGAQPAVGRISGRVSGDAFELGIVRAAALVDLARSATFDRRLALGAVARWDVEVERDPLGLSRHRVAPFSAAVLDARAESANGLTAADLRLEGGAAWTSDGGWGPALAAETSLERILIAINDRPLAIFFAASYRHRRAEPDDLRAQLGLRFALFQRRDPRVNLRPLSASSAERAAAD